MIIPTKIKELKKTGPDDADNIGRMRSEMLQAERNRMQEQQSHDRLERGNDRRLPPLSERMY